jgi:hypothetical protein
LISWVFSRLFKVSLNRVTPARGVPAGARRVSLAAR